MKDKVFVISIDSLQDDEVKYLQEKKNFERILKDYSMYSSILCSYPTYTYPCHASILTGQWPKDSGIYHNEPFDSERKRNRWFWWSDDKKCPDAIDIATQRGIRTASVTWPVTAGSKGDYVIPEIWPEKGEDPDTVFLPYSSKEVLDIYRKNKKALCNFHNPFYPDEFAVSCSVDIIKEKKPDLFFLHLSALDTNKHSKGLGRDSIDEAITFLDGKIGEILDAIDENGDFPAYTFFILGDHGQMKIENVFAINRVLKDMGYISDEREWRIMAHPSSFSAEVYLRNIGKEEAYDVLSSIKNKYPEAISRIMSTEETDKKYGLSGPFSFVLESEGGVIFSSSLSSPVFSLSKSAATHGYAPERGPKPPFIISGRRGVKNKRYVGGRLIDEAPTILSLFSIEMEGVEGRVLEGLVTPPQDKDL